MYGLLLPFRVHQLCLTYFKLFMYEPVREPEQTKRDMAVGTDDLSV